MFRAVRGIDGKKPYTLSQYIQIEGGKTNPKEWEKQPHCSECRQEVIGWDKPRAATGVYAARDEVTKPHLPPHYNHHQAKPGDPYCGARFRDKFKFESPNARELINNTLFHDAELARNQFAIEEPAMRRALDRMQDDIMFGLTRTHLSDQDKKDLAKAEKSLITMAGLAQHMWLLPYMKALFISTRERETHGKHGMKISRVLLDPSSNESKGTQKLRVTFADGEQGEIVAPLRLYPSFFNPKVKGKYRIKHMENPKTHVVTVINVTRELFDMYYALEKRNLEQERTAAKAEATEKATAAQNPAIEEERPKQGFLFGRPGHVFH